jgi:hypothetical protein
VLKNYWYAYFDREIVLIDGLEKKIVAVIPLPAKFVRGDQKHHGAAEPQESSAKGGPSTTGSVPAYTSSETIK